MYWWEKSSWILKQEIKELKDNGHNPELNQEAFSNKKILISITIEIFGNTHKAQILYPDLYPYFRPILITPNLDYNLRHYNPVSGENCLLRRGSRYWQPSMTAAKLISEMLPEWELAAVRKFEDSRLESEDKQAEPKSVYFGALPNQHVALDSTWSLGTGQDTGVMKIVFSGGKKRFSPKERLMGWVLELKTGDSYDTIVAQAEPEIVQWAKSYHSDTTFTCRWSRLESPPLGENALKILEWIEQASPPVSKRINADIQRNQKFGLYALSFPEEAPSGGFRDGWIFVAWNLENSGHNKHRVTNLTTWLIKSEPGGKDDLFERIPELYPLQSKKVAVVGLGCVGAPSVLAFARSGIGELRLVDGDFVGPGTICRWPLGLSVAGGGKVFELSEFIRKNFPFTRIGKDHYPPGVGDDFRFTIGQPDSDYNQLEYIQRLVDGVDLIYDASAEDGINQLLADLAKERNIPYIMIGSRPGGWGGHVVRIRPDDDSGCFLCYLYAYTNGGIPQPPYDPEGDALQPVGCGDLTFKAAGFDVEEIALAGVRLAVSTLCEGAEDCYPKNSSDVGILSLRKDSESIFPSWQSFLLPKNVNCPVCGNEKSLDQ